MECISCGADNPPGTYYCGGCGRPMGATGPGPATLVDEPGLDDVPVPAMSRDTPLPSAPTPELRSTRPGKALCSMCMGAYPETSMTVVDGSAFCPDCSPMTGRRGVPESEEGGVGSPDDVALAPPGTLYYREEPTAGPGSKAILFGLVVLLVGGAVFAAVALLGGDRIDQLLAGVDTSRTDAPLLVQKYAPGESHYYTARGKLEMEIEGSSDFGNMFGQGTVVEVEAALAGRLAVDVLSVDDRGNSRLQMTLEGFNATLEGTMDGEKLALPPGAMAGFTNLNGMKVEMEVDAFGETIGTPRVTWPGGGGTGGNAGVTDMLQGQLSGVPRKEVRVGDTWTSSAALPGQMGKMPLGGMNVSVTYEALGYKKHAGRDCLVIALNGDVSGGDSMDFGLPGEIDLDMKMKGAIFFDPGAGRLVKSAMDVDCDMSLSFGGNDASFSMKLELDVDLD